ncbi:thioredoxin reductase-like selenoprotein T homolog CG3887 [Contarinia nasturtii]|uniref:thioredoxin reductase-like selenoprotein T homolog CG3887 n=1 Tax=Contarinia nasturtii TaxID=265458 RepID=UPI0012D3DAAA|nr:thioredoxin reductase-like selenoprotein T homolog CG3887 [Contarinia nasturtii]
MISRIGSVICICFIISLFAICGGSGEKEVPQMAKFRPTMKFLYCYSCGYRKAFEEYVNIINERYPQISIEGANYDPPGLNFLLSKAILAVKMIFILIIVSQYDVWGQIGQAVPRWFTWCTENKIYACMMVFFVGNMLEAQLVSSGAFEISLNDIPIWSKLDSGRIPSPQELFNIIDNQIKVFSDALPAGFDQ